MIPLGAQVRWRPDVYKAPPIGTVTARKGRMLDIDGRGWWVSEGLLEVVGMDAHEIEHVGKLHDAIVRLTDERDALQAVVIQQCEALAALSGPSSGTVPAHKLEELQEDFERLRDAVRTMFLNVFETREPSGMDCRAKGIDASDLIAEMARYEG